MSSSSTIIEWDFAINALQESLERERTLDAGDDLARFSVEDSKMLCNSLQLPTALEIMNEDFGILPDPGISDGTNTLEDPNQIVSVSTAFAPTSYSTTFPADIVLMSSDLTAFYVNKQALSRASSNLFNHFLDPMKIPDDTPENALMLTEQASVLNIVLHTIYDISCVQYSPTLGDLLTAIRSLYTYGIDLDLCVKPRSPLFIHLLSHIPVNPLEIYTVAASFKLEELAKAASSQLMSYPLYRVSDESASKIGTAYLMRLFKLHWNRKEELKRLLLAPPLPHAETVDCDFTKQKNLTRAWALATARLVWDAQPDTSARTIEEALRPLQDLVICNMCKDALRNRTRDLVVQWTMANRTI